MLCNNLNKTKARKTAHAMLSSIGMLSMYNQHKRFITCSRLMLLCVCVPSTELIMHMRIQSINCQRTSCVSKQFQNERLVSTYLESFNTISNASVTDKQQCVVVSAC
jgi:hypothetical protein